MADNSKQTKADAQALGRHRRIIMERKRERERQDALMRQRLSAARPAADAQAPRSVAARPDSRIVGHERVLADDGTSKSWQPLRRPCFNSSIIANAPR